MLAELRATLARGDADASAAVYDTAVQHELDSTRSLRAWPCESLWVDKDNAALRPHAQALVPNCSTPYTICSVKHDKCEMQGTCGPGKLK